MQGPSEKRSAIAPVSNAIKRMLDDGADIVGAPLVGALPQGVGRDGLAFRKHLGDGMATLNYLMNVTADTNQARVLYERLVGSFGAAQEVYAKKCTIAPELLDYNKAVEGIVTRPRDKGNYLEALVRMAAVDLGIPNIPKSQFGIPLPGTSRNPAIEKVSWMLAASQLGLAEVNAMPANLPLGSRQESLKLIHTIVAEAVVYGRDHYRGKS